MRLEFTLALEDYLIHQLYTITRSARAQKTRKMYWLYPSVFFFLIGLMDLYKDNQIGATTHIIISLIWLFFFPLYYRWLHWQHCKGLIVEYFKDMIGQKNVIEIEDNYILESYYGSERKIYYNFIEEINDLPTLILIKLKTSESLIIPKAQIANLDELKAKLKETTASQNIIYNNDVHWKWKRKYYSIKS
jgi:hypothetical protein